MSDRNPPADRPENVSGRDGFFQSLQTPALRTPAFKAAETWPDRRGEALQIFTTIFVRPALDMQPSIRRIAGACALAARHLASELAATSPRLRPGRLHHH